MAVTGLVRPGEQVTNSGAMVGDSLVLTKAIGTGIITTAGKDQKASADTMAGTVRSMSMLNHDASHAMTEVGVNACVDVTGYGVVGHLLGMLAASGVEAHISASAVPVLDGTMELLAQGIAPGGTRRNLKSADRFVDWGPITDERTRLLLCDAQTSGGLLISVTPDKRNELTARLEQRGVETRAVIGEIVESVGSDGHRLRIAH